MILVSFVVWSKCDISVITLGRTINTKSVPWILMAWCFCARTSMAAMLIMHPCLSSCLWAKPIKLQFPTTHVGTTRPRTGEFISDEYIEDNIFCTPTQRSWMGGILDSACLSICRHDCGQSQKPIDFQRCHFQTGRLAAILDFSFSGLCRWHGFQSMTRLCFEISVSNFMCMSFLAMGLSPLIFNSVTFKMATWQPY